MAEGKKQQVARTAANKARNARRAARLAESGKSMWMPRGSARALRRATKFFVIGIVG